MSLVLAATPPNNSLRERSPKPSGGGPAFGRYWGSLGPVRGQNTAKSVKRGRDRSSLSTAVASARRRAVSLPAREQSAGELAKGLKALFDPRMPGRAATQS